MKTIAVGKGDNLQYAFDTAQPGDEIAIEPREQFIGNFNLPQKPSSQYPVIVRSAATLPDGRITPADVGLLPSIGSPNAEQAINCESDNWVLRGLNLKGNPGGFAEVIRLQNASKIIMDRLLLVIQPDEEQKRGILGNGTHITVVKSHIAGVNRPGQDSQAFCAWDGAGPYTLVDDFFEAASENVMFGGAGALSVDRIPSDILVDNCDFFKPLSWKGQNKGVKNLFELKTAKRVIVRNSLFENCWSDAQSGYAIVFTVRNDNADAPWSTIEDVLFTNCVIRNTDRGVNILGYNDGSPSGQLTKLVLEGNDFETHLVFAQIGGEAGVVTIRKNKVRNGGFAIQLYSGQIWPNTDSHPRDAEWAVETLYNLENEYSDPTIFGDGVGPGQPAIDKYIEHYNPDVPIPPDPPDPPIPPIEPEVPKVAIKSVTRKGNSTNYAVAVEASEDAVKIEFIVNDIVQATLTAEPYRATIKARINETITVRAYNADNEYGEDTWQV